RTSSGPRRSAWWASAGLVIGDTGQFSGAVCQPRLTRRILTCPPHDRRGQGDGKFVSDRRHAKFTLVCERVANPPPRHPLSESTVGGMVSVLRGGGLQEFRQGLQACGAQIDRTLTRANVGRPAGRS